MKRTKTLAVSLALAAALCGTALTPVGLAQQARSRRAADALPADDDPIELSTDVVNVVFSVTDKTNRFVGDLKQSDIVVTENGSSQQIFSFQRETNLPLEVAILVDVSSSQETTFGDEKRAASAFLQKVLKPKRDSAAVLQFREDVTYVQGMTGRLSYISDAFNNMTWDGKAGGGTRAGATALYDAVAVAASEAFPRNEQTELVTRRAVILITDGADTDSQRSLSSAVDEALRADVIVYAIGIGDRYRSTAIKRDVLDSLTRQTGGRAYYPESYDDLTGAFQQIEDELRSQYLLAYEPSRLTRDGAYHEITIKVPGRADVRVSHRKGYFAPQGDSAAPPKGATAPAGPAPTSAPAPRAQTN